MILKLPWFVGKTPRIEMTLVSKKGREGDWLCGVGIAQPEFRFLVLTPAQVKLRVSVGIFRFLQRVGTKEVRDSFQGGRC